MPKEQQILDIGIGSGGEYIGNNTALHEQRIGIDIDGRKLPGLRYNYPEVFPLQTNAEQLPFGDNTFSRIEVVLPFGELTIPGLQKDHFALKKTWRDEYAQTHPDGWYPELHRVLVPQGELVIFGDAWVDPVQVQLTSQRLFEVEHVKPLTIAEFRALGTSVARAVIDKGRNSKSPYIDKIGRRWSEMLVKINLRSTKAA